MPEPKGILPLMRHMKKILLLAEPGDVHAIAVAEGLARKGGVPLLWCTSDFPSRAFETISFEKDKRALSVETEEMQFSDEDIDVVWRRRTSYVLDPAWLH